MTKVRLERWYTQESAYEVITNFPMFKIKTNHGKRLVGANVNGFKHCIASSLPKNKERVLLNFSSWPIYGVCIFCKRHVSPQFGGQRISPSEILGEILDEMPDIYKDGELRTHCCYCDLSLRNIIKRNNDDISTSIDILLAKRIQLINDIISRGRKWDFYGV